MGSPAEMPSDQPSDRSSDRAPDPLASDLAHATADDLLVQTYAELRRLAAGYLRSERSGHTLQATALVHEAWCRLAPRAAMVGTSREQFIAAAATAMRRILVDHARARGAIKRGGPGSAHGGERLSLDPDLVSSAPDVDLIALDDALSHLRSLDVHQARLVELRFFGGLTLEEAASLIGMSPRTADREWALAKAWLWQALRNAEDVRP